MKKAGKLTLGSLIVALTVLIVATTAFASGGNGLWLFGGHDLNNTRHAKTETKISPENVSDLGVKWVVETGGDVSATPAVDGTSVYVPDWAGNLFKRTSRYARRIFLREEIPKVGHSKQAV